MAIAAEQPPRSLLAKLQPWGNLKADKLRVLYGDPSSSAALASAASEDPGGSLLQGESGGKGQVQQVQVQQEEDEEEDSAYPMDAEPPRPAIWMDAGMDRELRSIGSRRESLNSQPLPAWEQRDHWHAADQLQNPPEAPAQPLPLEAPAQPLPPAQPMQLSPSDAASVPALNQPGRGSSSSDSRASSFGARAGGPSRAVECAINAQEDGNASTPSPAPTNSEQPQQSSPQPQHLRPAQLQPPSSRPAHQREPLHPNWVSDQRRRVLGASSGRGWVPSTSQPLSPRSASSEDPSLLAGAGIRGGGYRAGNAGAGALAAGAPSSRASSNHSDRSSHGAAASASDELALASALDAQHSAGPSGAAARLGPIQGPLRGSRLQGFVTAVANPAYVSSAAVAGPSPGPGLQAAAAVPRGVQAPPVLAALQSRGASHHPTPPPSDPEDAELAAVQPTQQPYPVLLASQAAAAGAAVVAALDAFPGRWAPAPSAAALRPTRAHNQRDPARWSSPAAIAMAALSGHGAPYNMQPAAEQPPNPLGQVHVQAQVVAAAAEVLRLTGTMFGSAAPAVAFVTTGQPPPQQSLQQPSQQQQQQQIGRSCGGGMQRRQSLAAEPAHARPQQRHRATDGWYPAPGAEAHSKGLPPAPEVSSPPSMPAPAHHSSTLAGTGQPPGGCSIATPPHVAPTPAPEAGLSAARTGKGSGSSSGVPLPMGLPYDDPGAPSSASFTGAAAGGGGTPPTTPRRLLISSHGLPTSAALTAAAAAAGAVGGGGSTATNRAVGNPSGCGGTAAATRAGGGRSARAAPAAPSNGSSQPGVAARSGGGHSARGVATPSGGSTAAATPPVGTTSWLNDGVSRLQALAAGGEIASPAQQGHHARALRSSLAAGHNGPGAGAGGGGGGANGGSSAAFLSMGLARSANTQRQHGRVH